MFVHMLGMPFYISTDEKAEIYEMFTTPMLRNRSIKMLHLLAYLVYHHGEMIERAQLLVMLYGEDYDEAAYNNLRAIIFRLRKILGKIGLPEGNCILSRKGTYGWNDELCSPLIDAEQYKEKAEKALSIGNEETEKKIRALKEATLYCKGSFLPLFENETWVIHENLKFRKLLGGCMDVLYQLLEQRGRQDEIIPICNNLLSISPDEKWYLFQIRAYLSMKEMDLAYHVYEEAIKVLVDRMGRQLSEEFGNIFRGVNKNPERSFESINDIRKMLDDKEVPHKTYYCSFPSFIDAYRVSSRLMQRTKSSSFLILCTLTTSDGCAIENKDKLEKMSDQLKEAIMDSARGSDMMTRYSMSQFLLLLNGIGREECSVVTARIDQKFRQVSTSPNYRVNYYISSIKDSPPLSAITEYQQDSTDN